MRIAWVTFGRMVDPIDGRVYPSDIVEADGRLTSTKASARLRLLIPKAALESRGHRVELLRVDSGSFDSSVARLSDFDAVVFKKTLKRGQFVADLFERTAAIAVPTLFDICDLRVDAVSEGGSRNLRMLRAADRVITSTPPLAEALRSLGAQDVRVVTDPYEGPRGEPAWQPHTDRLKALWFGHPSNLDTTTRLVEELASIGRQRAIQLTLVTGRVPDLLKRCKELNQRWRHALALRYEEWSPEGLWAALAATDLVVIPSLTDSAVKLVKSPNRVVESFWAGRCVIANPLPAYAPFAQWAFIDESIRGGLERALSEQDRIVDRVRAAQAYISDAHSPDRIGEEWERAIVEAVEAKRQRGSTSVPAAASAPSPPPLRVNPDCGDKRSMNQEPGERYLRWYYDTAVWKNLHYRGIRTLKNPSDMWNYQEIITSRGIQWVVETGTRHGGSALFFADLLAAAGAEGVVVSIDVTARDNWVRSHPRIRFVIGDSASAEVVREVTAMLASRGAPLFIILDSDHTKAHVLRELEAWVPTLRSGDYLVVEDTCINGHPVRPDFGPGPYEAVDAFLAAHPNLLVHDRDREVKFGHTFAPHGYFVRA